MLEYKKPYLILFNAIHIFLLMPQAHFIHPKGRISLPSDPKNTWHIGVSFFVDFSF